MTLSARLIPRILLTCILCLLTVNIHAQTNGETDDVQSLGEILNSKKEYENSGKVLTAEIMANRYFAKCVAKESLAFNDSEKEILCACASAKMSDVLTIQEFKDLDNKRGYRGKDARGKAVAFAYIPCIEYALDSKITRSCRASPDLKDVIAGKKRICSCVNNKYKQQIHNGMKDIVMRSLRYEPMTINPFEFYFQDKDHTYYVRRFIENCRFEYKYEKYN